MIFTKAVGKKKQLPCTVSRIIQATSALSQMYEPAFDEVNA